MLKAGTMTPPTRRAQEHPADNVLLSCPLFSWHFHSSFSTRDGARSHLLSSFAWCSPTRVCSQALVSIQVSRLILQCHSHVPSASWAGRPGQSFACHTRARYLYSAYAAPAEHTLNLLNMYLPSTCLRRLCLWGRKKYYPGKQRLHKCSKRSEQLLDSSMKSG